MVIGSMKETIFVIDHDEGVRRLLSGILAKKGYEVREIANGLNTVAMVRETRPDLVLLDIFTPSIDGYEVCRGIKNDPSIADTPIIFLSAKADSADKARGLEIGGADYVTKPFDEREVIARVENQLKFRRLTNDLLKANRDLTEKQRRLDEDLKVAGGIQQSLLPRTAPDIRNLRIAWRFVPSHLIGGDIFNVFYLDESHAGFYMADVSGHGVPSALVAFSLSQMLHPHINSTTKRRISGPPGYEIVPPSGVLDTLDKEYPIERFDMYFTIVYLIIDIRHGTLVYSNGAHPYPVIIRSDGEIEILEKGGTLIGLGGILPFEEGESTLRKGDKLVVYTDGLVGLKDNAGEFFGEERLYALLVEERKKDAEAVVNEIIRRAREFSGTDDFQDDLTLAVIELDRGEGNAD